jgi:hypothetical protein
MANADGSFRTINDISNLIYNQALITAMGLDENGKKHRHYVDIFISSQNRCVEVKSTWTAEKKKDNIFLKQTTAKELGYNYEIWVYNSKGIRVEKYE